MQYTSKLTMTQLFQDNRNLPNSYDARIEAQIRQPFLHSLIKTVFATLLLAVSLSSSAADGSKPVYGSDDRQEWDRAEARVCAVGQATAAIMLKTDLEVSDSKRWSLTNNQTLIDSNWCAEERFLNQPNLAICTAFLINASKMVTAAHCINAPDEPDGPAYNCAEIVFVFDYAIMDDGEIRRRYNDDQVYHCKSVLQHQHLYGSVDWTVVELDRTTKRAPLALYTGNIASVIEQSLEVVGHPLGLPLKWVRNGTVIYSDSADVFTAAIDTFEGNSGSPILIGNSLQPLVAGILSGGARDYRTSKQGCLSTRVCNTGECGGEVVTSATAFAHHSDSTRNTLFGSVSTPENPDGLRASCL